MLLSALKTLAPQQRIRLVRWRKSVIFRPGELVQDENVIATSPSTSRIAPTDAVRAPAMTFTGDAIVIIGSGIIGNGRRCRHCQTQLPSMACRGAKVQLLAMTIRRGNLAPSEAHTIPT